MNIYTQLKDNLWASVEYPEQFRTGLAKIDTWRNFVALPQDAKNHFSSDIFEKMDTGYRMRSRNEGRENKEYFHYSERFANSLNTPETQELINTYPEIKAFFDFSQTLYSDVYDIIYAFAKDIEENSDGKAAGLTKEVEQAKDRLLVRFLHYTPTQDEGVSGDSHFDRSGFTLHLYESHTGLQLLPLSEKGKPTEEMNWIDAPMDENHTVIFTGYQLEKLTDGDLKATWHRVENRLQDSNNTRISVVVFVPLPNTETYDSAARSQDLFPGSNY